jgi:uncharacterized protein
MAMTGMHLALRPAWRWWLLMLALVAGVAAAVVAVPPFTAYVTDQTATLTREEIQALEQKLTAFANRKGSQVAVLIVPTTAPESIEQYSIRVAEQWKLGRKGVDDGALLLVAKNDRALRIEVGYGLEGVLPDAINKRIIAEVITPYFQKGDFAGGINAGVDQMIKRINGEPLPPPAQNTPQEGQEVSLLAILVGALFVGHILTRLLGRLAGATLGGVGAGLVTATVAGSLMALGIGILSFLAILLGIWFFPGMGGGGGGNDRGGFRGGGGGGFGGGGASGRW